MSWVERGQRGTLYTFFFFLWSLIQKTSEPGDSVQKPGEPQKFTSIALYFSSKTIVTQIKKNFNSVYLKPNGLSLFFLLFKNKSGSVHHSAMNLCET